LPVAVPVIVVAIIAAVSKNIFFLLWQNFIIYPAMFLSHGCLIYSYIVVPFQVILAIKRSRTSTIRHEEMYSQFIPPIIGKLLIASLVD